MNSTGMNRSGMIARTPRLLSLAVACMLVLAITGTTDAGIQGSGFRSLSAIGTVDGDAGLTVNGVTYDTAEARVIINGKAAEAASIHSGQVVWIHGTVSAGGTLATAQEVTLFSDVRGEVTDVDATTGVVSVLGQSVRTTRKTVLDPAIQGMGVAGLQRGMFINVSGFATADGSLLASSIDIDPTPEQAQVRGVIQALDLEHQSLRIGALTVDYSGAAIEGTIAEGAVVAIQGVEPSALNSLVATNVQVFAGVGNAGDRGDVKGIITTFASDSDFEVNGQPVQADSKTVYILHGTSLGTDVAVRVTGTFDASGILVADKIQTDAPESARGAGGAKSK